MSDNRIENRLKITVILGTRPEIIRLSEIIKAARKVFEVRLVFTGQNHQPYLGANFLEELKIGEPDLSLGLAELTIGEFLSGLFSEMEKELISNRPDAILVLGDTNSGLTSVLARRLRIPVYHLEAGNRSFDDNVPEEINRRIIDHASDFNLAYTETARFNLLSEGFHPRKIAVVGSPMKEVILANTFQGKSSELFEKFGVSKNEYFVFSSHRQENVDNPERLKKILNCLEILAVQENSKVLVSGHPRFMSYFNKSTVTLSENVKLCEPFGYADFLYLQQNAKCVVSDSGSLSEEAAILGFKAISLRDSTERPEAIEAGNVILSGTNSIGFTQSLEIVNHFANSKSIPPEYQIEDTSIRVVSFIQSTVHQSKFWSGLR